MIEMTPTTAKDMLKRLMLTVALAGVIGAAAGWAQDGATTIHAERYVPTIWVDPDGCEHWVMDDGFEGFMTPHVTREGKPVCHRGNLCGEVSSDQLFASGSARISKPGQGPVAPVLQRDQGAGFMSSPVIPTAGRPMPITWICRCAGLNTVARIARASGARVNDVRGYGERQPKASNTTAAGMARNRRVEIMCIR